MPAPWSRARRLSPGQTDRHPPRARHRPGGLSARIDRLEPEAKRLLQLAAVIGKDVPFSLLRAIVRRPTRSYTAPSPAC